MSGTFINCFICFHCILHLSILHLSGLPIVNCFICICMWAPYVFTCVFILAYLSFVSLYMCLEFHTCIDCWHTVWFLPTVCRQIFVAALLPMHCFALCVHLCYVYVYINQFGAH